MATVSVGHQRQIMLLSTVCILAGLYLAVSPVLSHYQYSSGLTTVNVTLGTLIAAMSYFRGTIGGGAPWISWVLIGLGVITLGSPWWMHYAFVDSFRMQHLIVGGIVVGLQFLGAVMSHLVLAKPKS